VKKEGKWSNDDIQGNKKEAAELAKK